MRITGIVLLMGSLLFTCASAQAMPQNNTPPATGAPARPIAAWQVFCNQYPAECAVNVNEPAQISLTEKTWRDIITINRRVNRSVSSVTDQTIHGRPDVWDLAENGRGDCEDFQLLKRHLLVKTGLPRRAMRMTVVIDEKGEGHAILTLITDRGDVILDNKTNAVLPWDQTGYVFIKRESQQAPGWVSLGGATGPMATANP